MFLKFNRFKRNGFKGKRPFCIKVIDKRGSVLKMPTFDKKISTPEMKEIQIDISGLKKGPSIKPSKVEKEAKNKLVQVLTDEILLRGPMSVATFMRHCLTNPQYGYYVTKDSTEVFGKRGDFITSPDISQMFGELIGVWAVSVHSSMGSPRKIRLVELGAGQGTLLKDLFRISRTHFRKFYSACELHIVERSPTMRQRQAKELNCLLDDSELSHYESQGSLRTLLSSSTRDGLEVHWHQLIDEVPKDSPTLVIAHEFLDALPIHQFQFEEKKGWLERLIDVDQNESDSPFHFQFVLSPGPTLASQSYVPQILPNFNSKNFNSKNSDSNINLKNSDSNINLNSDSNIDLKNINSKNSDSNPTFLEISPEGLSLVDHLSIRFSEQLGAALLIDYGYTSPSGNSLRAIKNHKFVDFFHDPGTSDLSAWVDFAAIERTVRKHPGVRFWGPSSQASFLQEMGIEVRLATLLRMATSFQAEQTISSYKRLIGQDTKGMGETYKAVCLGSKDLNIPGFV